MQSAYVRDDIERLNANVEMLLELATADQTKKVSHAREIVEKILSKEKVIPRKALKARTGVSDAELSRCLRELEDEGIVMRKVDTTDGRKTVCVYMESASSLSELDEAVLGIVHAHPELTYRELEGRADFFSRKEFQAAFYKLLCLGLVAQTECDGRLYAVVTAQGLEQVQKEATC